MSFWGNDTKRKAEPAPARKRTQPKGYIPIESLNKLGCSVCPRDKDKDLRSPKMAPTGSALPLIYLLGTGPNEEEDYQGKHWVGTAGNEIQRMFSGRFFSDDVRSGHITQCMPAIGGPGHPEVQEIECCRGRVERDIEASRPIVVVGVGDEPLHWATGLPRNALTFRGQLIATKIGRHSCWYYPIIYPNYLAKDREQRRSRKSEYQLALEHDIAWIEQAVEDGLEPPVVYEAPYDTGIIQITGQEPNDMVRLEDALHEMLGQPVGFDIETNCLRPYMHEAPLILTAALGTFDKTYAFVVDHPDGWGTETRMRRARGLLGEWIAQSGRKRCHNVAFEQEWSAFFYGNELLRLTEWDDTMAMAHVCDARKGTKSLDTQTRIHFGFFLKQQSRVDVSATDWWLKFPLKDILRYNGLDSKWAHKLAEVRRPVLCDDPRLDQLYEDYVRLAPTLVLTTARGMPVDFEYAEKMVVDINARCVAVEAKLRKLPELRAYERRFGTFNITNDHDVLKLMRDILERPEVERMDKKTQTLKETTDEEALLSMPADEVPSAKLILDHRGLRRNETTYLGPLVRREVTGPDGLLHYEFGSLHTVTSRLDSAAHNWPKHKFREVRGAIAADEGWWLVACDYGQIEFRVCGMLSGDENIIKYSWTSYDVHKYWAERLLKLYPRIVDWVVAEFEVDWDESGIKTLRQVMKNQWVFPALFGSSLKSRAGNCHMPLETAEEMDSEFWDEFRGHKAWQGELLKSYDKYLYVETLGGWRRAGPMTLNEAINAPIQGTAREIFVAGMNAVSERAQREDNVELQPIFNGHDDLTYRISDAKLESNVAIIAEEMCKPRFSYINVPLIVEVSVGARWHQLKEIAKYSSEDLYGLYNPFK